MALDGTLPEPLRCALTEKLGRLRAITPLSGGSIAQTRRIDSAAGCHVLKFDAARAAPRFAAEADGLAALAPCTSIRVPAVIAHGVAGAHAFLLLEFIALRPLAEAGRQAGAALADVHHHMGTQYGWTRNNYLGSTPQANPPHADWATFFATQRLAPQLALAERQYHDAPDTALVAAGRRLIERLPHLLAGHTPPPSLTHGDLWQGNAALDGQGRLVLIDPAVHYADRECDLAMSRLFGGFPAAFYAGYAAAWPLPAGHAERETLYRLYHVLNHYNLFGMSYRSAAERLLAALA